MSKNKNTITVIIILILLALISFFVINNFLIKAKSKSCSVPVTTERTEVQVKPKSAAVVMNEPAIEEPVNITVQKEEITKPVTKKVPFWGNRGYLVKETKSTFVRYSILGWMKKEYESFMRSGGDN